jgi:hypothetical protein
VITGYIRRFHHAYLFISTVSFCVTIYPLRDLKGGSPFKNLSLLAKGEQRKGIKGLLPLNPARRLDSHNTRKVWLYREPVDFQKQMNGPVQLIVEEKRREEKRREEKRRAEPFEISLLARRWRASGGFLKGLAPFGSP